MFRMETALDHAVEHKTGLRCALTWVLQVYAGPCRFKRSAASLRALPPGRSSKAEAMTKSHSIGSGVPYGVPLSEIASVLNSLAPNL